MNGVRVEYEAKLKQTSKGVWYCDGVSCGDEKIAMLGSKLHLMMMEIEQQLFKHNNHEEPSDKDVA